MQNYYWNDWYAGWGWFLWAGVFVLFFSNLGNWGYTYRTHRRYRDFEGSLNQKDALDILNERYVRGEIKHEEYSRIKLEITRTPVDALKKSA